MRVCQGFISFRRLKAAAGMGDNGSGGVKPCIDFCGRGGL
ncbi:hypothetical protein KNP414_05508 [Paenibacillus mucilaginosus KNP414]|uniref:Uncharacterized protein n=1 Tax=Paenibacillus mucilaginosus (strain KNP414) TaxID=1036673 RepID=F8FJZ1_PAEMK|nr:hypothetical protein KNP414_05508 [Paenibacillus mucilaginosus KNP414]